MTEKNLVATHYPKVVDLFESPEINNQLKKALPDFISADKLIRVALTTIRTNPKLLECSRQSLIACLFACGQLGLSPEPFLGQAYFVPFYNSKLKSLEAQFIPGYRGYITLWRRSGVGKNLSAQVVYERDHFKLQYGLHEMLDHTPADGDRGAIKGAWTVFTYIDGTKTFDYMPYFDLMKIKERTKSRNSKGEIVGPWLTDEAEMCKKTVIRRHMKLAPLSIDEQSRLMYKASQAEELALTGGAQRGLFLPEFADETPIKVGSVKDRSDEFDKATDDVLRDPLFRRFLDITAESNEIPVNEVKTQAMDDLDGFMKVFHQWKTTQDKLEGDSLYDRLPGNQKKFWDEWRNKHRSGFKRYVADNLELFKSCDPDLYEVARKKYRVVVGLEWPLDPMSDPLESDSVEPGASEPVTTSVLPSGNNVEERFTQDELLSQFKDKYPRIYLRVTKGLTPRTREAKRETIDKIRAEIGEGDIPSA